MTTSDESFRVLEEYVTREEVGAALTTLGYTRRNIWPGDSDRDPYEEAWATPDETRAINYSEDPVTQTHFLYVRGAKVSQVLSQLEGVLEIIGPEEAIERLAEAESHDEQVEGLYRLAVTFPRVDYQVKALFEEFATKGPSPKLREAAVNAAGYRAWPELIPLLERVARFDADESVRAAAERILPALRKVAEQRSG